LCKRDSGGSANRAFDEKVASEMVQQQVRASRFPAIQEDRPVTPSANEKDAWAYLVVSSEQQAETLEHQESWARETAASHEWQIKASLRGVSSGRDGTRDLLETLLARLRALPAAARPARVLMIRLDRLGRGLGLEAVASIAELARLGVVIHTRQDGDYTLERASDSILPLMRVVTGAIENEARRDKAKAVFKRRREKGQVVCNKRPYGLRMEGNSDVAQEPQAQAVRLAFELAVNGYGLGAIGIKLAAVAAPKLYVNGRSHQTEWTTNRVAMLLRQSAYRGTLVAVERWNQVQLLFARRPQTRGRSKHPWPLAGSLHCTCGRVLIGSVHGSIPRRVYRCTARTIHGRNLMYNANKLEEAFVHLIERLSASPELATLYTASSEAALSEEALRGREAELQAATQRHDLERKRAWSLNERGLIPDVELAKRLREIDKVAVQNIRDRDTVRLELDMLEERQRSAIHAAAIVGSAAAAWSNSSVELKRTAAQALARALGGIHVVAGDLRLGPPPAPDRFCRT
jgi:DNA invertase Pin-like site-specific DNA recombinase